MRILTGNYRIRKEINQDGTYYFAADVEYKYKYDTNWRGQDVFKHDWMTVYDSITDQENVCLTKLTEWATKQAEVGVVSTGTLEILKGIKL